jgi:TRAP-type C4-dicarboxylate transport system substrate-binding protein
MTTESRVRRVPAGPAETTEERAMIRSSVVSLTLAFAAATAVQAADMPSVNLKVSGGNQTQNIVKYLQKPFFTKELSEKSNGAVTATYGSLEELGIKGPEVLRLLRLGIFDISEGTLSYMAGEDPRFDALDLPGVTPDIDTQRKTVDAFRPVLAKAMAEKFNTKLLVMNPIAVQVFYCKGQITGLDSLKGKKVRTFNRAMADLVEGAGASTINLPFAEVVPAMQRGVADCAITGTSAGNTARWWEVSDHLYMLPMGWSMTFLAANLTNWQRLDAKTREFLEKEFVAYEDRAWAQAKSDVQDGINCNVASGTCKDGIVATTPMKLVPLSDPDRASAQKVLRERVLPEFAKRCGAECAKQWNETVGKVVGLQAAAN